MLEANWRTLKHVRSNINILTDHFMLVEDDGEEDMGGAENDEEHDTDMERVEVDMVDITMNKTL